MSTNQKIQSVSGGTIIAGLIAAGIGLIGGFLTFKYLKKSENSNKQAAVDNKPKSPALINRERLTTEENEAADRAL